MKLLRDRGVIQGFINRLPLAQLGLHRFNLLISTAHSGEAVSRELSALCEQRSEFVNLCECIGPWIFEASVDVARPDQVLAIIQGLYDSLGGSIANITALPIFQSYKYNCLLSPKRKRAG